MLGSLLQRRALGHALLRGAALLYSLPRGALGHLRLWRGALGATLLRGGGGDALLRRVTLHELLRGDPAPALPQESLRRALLRGTLGNPPKRLGIAAGHPLQGPEPHAIPLRRAFGDLLRPALVLARGRVLDPARWEPEFGRLRAPGRARREALGHTLLLGAAGLTGLVTRHRAQLHAGLPAGQKASGLARLRVEHDTLLYVGLARQQGRRAHAGLRARVSERLRVALPPRHRALDHAYWVACGTPCIGLGCALRDGFGDAARSRQVQLFVPLPIIVHGRARGLCLKDQERRQRVPTSIGWFLRCRSPSFPAGIPTGRAHTPALLKAPGDSGPGCDYPGKERRGCSQLVPPHPSLKSPETLRNWSWANGGAFTPPFKDQLSIHQTISPRRIDIMTLCLTSWTPPALPTATSSQVYVLQLPSTRDERQAKIKGVSML